MALIFIDLDGTVLNNGKPAKGVIEGIKKLKENKHIVAIATGRSPVLLYDHHITLGIDYLILSNGSYVMHNNKIIYERYIPNDIVKRTMEIADEIKADLVIEYLDGYVSYRKDSDVSDRFSETFQIEKPNLDRTFYPTKNVFSMVVFENDQLEYMFSKLPELDFHKATKFGYDVNMKGDLKAEGVRELIKYLQYSSDDIYAIGDGPNDIQMLQEVKHGIAMGNAVSSLKEVAEFVTTNVDDFGFVNALKHYNLI